MEAKICDRCGEICGDEKYKITCEKFVKRQIMYLGGEEIVNYSYEYDFCIKCASEFEKWLEREEDNNAEIH